MDDDHARLFAAKYQPQPQPCLPVFPKPYRFGQMELCMAHLPQPLPVCHGCDRPVCNVCRQRFDIEQEGAEYLRELARQDDGFLMFSSHIGCYEVAGYSLTPPGKRYNALVYGGEKDRIMEGRQEQFSEHNITMIPVKEDMSHLFKINEALVNHEIVSMPADRVMGSSKTIPTEFLGKTAHFPSGPFAVATMRDLEVLAINVIRISRKKYKIFVVPLAYDKQASRKQKMEQLAKKYAEELECLVRQYPDQWYNFYDFWADKNAEPSIA